MDEGIKITNYSDIILSCFSNDATSYQPMVREHWLVYLLSGEMEINEAGKTVRLHKDDCAFIRKDNRVSFQKLPLNGEQFKAIWLKFPRNF
ncbi:MAG: AraC family transcriptional regulator, partial [Prevotellaceae bacterium]|nr:AraC family transcriptional regulator [Prevotellaceae bacterium]